MAETMNNNDVATRIRTYSMLKWCGMPYNVRILTPNLNSDEPTEAG